MEVGDSRVITLPKSWLEYAERESGVEIKEVAIEVDKVLVVSPIIAKANKAMVLNE